MSCSSAVSDYPGVASKCFLVTGASGGIGGECAILLSELGARVILNGRNQDRLAQTRAKMAGNGHVIAPGDLKDMDYKNWLEKITAEAGMELAGVAHCAGSHAFAPLRAFGAQRLRDALEDHVISATSLFHAVSRLKQRAPACSLAIMSSISAHFGIAGNALYGAARACMDSLCRSFAVEFAPLGIRCNIVNGGFMTGGVMTGSGAAKLGAEAMDKIALAYPLGLGKVRDAANALVFLLGSASSWITGSILTVDGGQSIKGA